MKRLSQQKRNQIILTAVGTVAVVFGIWFSLIRSQQAGLKQLNEQIQKTQDDLARIQSTERNSTKIKADLLVISNQLAVVEQDMAAGDYYSSMVGAIKKFKQNYKIEIPQFNNPGTAPVEMNMLPKFPYKQFTVAISGTANFHDLGQFISDFENQFPSSRMLNLEITPASAQNSEEKEKLSFRVDVVSLTASDTLTPPGKP